MKKIIIGVASLIMIGLIAGLFLYERSNQIESPQEIIQKPISKPKQLQPIYVDEHVGYALQNNELHITLNQGKDWLTVPIEKDQLFNGNYNGNKQNLIEQSYIISKDRMAFLYLDAGVGSVENNRLLVTYSFDQGNTWEDSVVAESHPAIGFRKVNFLSEQFGYVIVSGERVVSQEASYIYTTNDGGEHWRLTNHPDTTSLVYDGGFVDELTGFLSVGYTNPTMPELHVTQDGGDNWSEANINVPTEFSEIFLIAEMPFKEADHLVVLVNQGPNGDYKGGRVKGKFISQDQGSTWEFAEEVDPDEWESE